MKVKLLISRVGIDFAHAVGDEIEVDEDEGKSLIAAGQAVKVLTLKKENAASKTRVEKAIEIE